VGPRVAEELVLSGRISTAAELHELGVVDVLAKDGEGEAATYNWIRKNQKRRNGMQAVFAARQHVQPINREELDAIADVWVDAALRLEDKDLRMMARIVRSQQRRMRGEEKAEALIEAAA
jgi:DSF synthase